MRIWLRKHWSILVLAGIVATADVIAVLWVFRVPIFQSADESSHFDYVVHIYSRGRLLNSADRHGVSPEERARYANLTEFEGIAFHPATEYLINQTKFECVAFRTHWKADADHGTRKFYARIDQDAPNLDDAHVKGVPWVYYIYPPGYYSVLACWLRVVRWVTPSLVISFYMARLFSVVLLTGTLLFCYASLRKIGRPKWQALWVTGLVGAFPLTSFVASYIQPDNLAWFLVSASIYVSLYLRTGGHRWAYPTLGLLLGLLLFTKWHFCLCVALAVVAILLVRVFENPQSWSNPRGWLGAIGIVVVLVMPGLVMHTVHLTNTAGIESYYVTRIPEIRHPSKYFTNALDGLRDFVDGTTFISFWGRFGWLDTPLVVKGPLFQRAYWVLLRLTFWGVLALLFLRFERVGSRLIRIAWGGHPRLALRAATSDPSTNALLLFACVMVALYARCGNYHGAQGRNWIPFLAPILLLMLFAAPQALSGRWSRIAATAVIGLVLTFHSTVGSYYSFESITTRYFGADRASSTSVASLPAVVLEPKRSTPTEYVPLGAGIRVSQSFVPHCIDLSGVRIQTVNWDNCYRPHRCAWQLFELDPDGSRTLVRKGRFEASRAGDFAALPIEFEPIQDCVGKQYCLVFSAWGTPNHQSVGLPIYHGRSGVVRGLSITDLEKGTRTLDDQSLLLWLDYRRRPR